MLVYGTELDQQVYRYCYGVRSVVDIWINFQRMSKHPFEMIILYLGTCMYNTVRKQL